MTPSLTSSRPPPGLRIEPSYATGPADTPLWVPPRLKRKIVVPTVSHTMKTIYFKGRLFVSRPTSDVDTRWFGGVRRCHYNVDIDEPGNDGLTVRDHIQLYLTGLLERVRGGRWVFQQGDERHSTTVIQEIPEFEHSPEHWTQFMRREG